MQKYYPVILAVIILFAGNSFNTRTYAQNNTSTSGTSTVMTPPHPSPQHQASTQDRQGNENNHVYQRVEKEPEYPGGTEALFKFLGENLKYPDLAKLTKTQGRVFVYFVVKSDGTVDNISLIKGIGNGCDEEALRVIKLMPKWIPGENKGKKVNVAFYLPIKFKLDTIQKQK
jgi:TonB family protein